MAGPSGHIFSREAILENLLAQKKANKRKLKAWEAQQREEARKVRRRFCAVLGLFSVVSGVAGRAVAGCARCWLACWVAAKFKTQSTHPTPPHLPS